MCKKAIFTSAAVALGLLVLSQTRFGHKVTGLAELAWNKVSNCVSRSVPLDVEINLIENEIGKMDRDVKKNFDSLAQEMVAYEEMKKEVDLVRTNLQKRMQVLERMRRDLKNESAKIVYDNREVSRSQLENKFTQDWNSFKVSQEGLKVKEKLLQQKQDHVEAFKAKIDAIQNEREALKTQVLKMKTELEELRATQAQCKVQVDDSRLGSIKDSLNNVQHRISVLKKKAELEGRFANSTITVPVEAKIEANKALDEFDSRTGDNDKVTVEK